MKNIILALALVMSLSACGKSVDIGVGVENIKAPPLPEHYAKKAERLPDITDPSFGGIMINSTETDIEYNNLAYRYNELVDIYYCVTKALNERKNTKCF